MALLIQEQRSWRASQLNRLQIYRMFLTIRGCIHKQFPLHIRTFPMAAVDDGDPKRARISSFSMIPAAPKRIDTHNGSFHCDEALGCFTICLTDKFSGTKIIRSRDPKVLNTLDAVLDVGGIYNPSQDRFDHHQKGFNEVFGHGFNTKLSSAGLVYKYYGMELIAKELQLDEGHEDVLEHCVLSIWCCMVWRMCRGRRWGCGCWVYCCDGCDVVCGGMLGLLIVCSVIVDEEKHCVGIAVVNCLLWSWPGVFLRL